MQGPGPLGRILTVGSLVCSISETRRLVQRSRMEGNHSRDSLVNQGVSPLRTRLRQIQQEGRLSGDADGATGSQRTPPRRQGSASQARQGRGARGEALRAVGGTAPGIRPRRRTERALSRRRQPRTSKPQSATLHSSSRTGANPALHFAGTIYRHVGRRGWGDGAQA